MKISYQSFFGTCLVLLMLSGCTGAPSSTNGTQATRSNVAHSPDASQTSKLMAVPPQLPPQTTPVIPPITAYAPGKMKVAILLPLTGKYASLGQGMLNAAQQAVFDVAAANFELMPRDTNGSDEQVEMAARDALASGAQLLIGPVFAAHVPIVRNVAEANEVNMLTLSTDTTVASPGVYVMGFAPGAQVERVVSYAAAHGVKRFAAIVPANPYGAIVGQALQATADRVGGSVIAIDSYDSVKHDSEAAVRDLSSRKDAIDAILLPEGGAELKLLITQLNAAGFDPHLVHVLGTGLWDVPGLAKEDAFMVGAWYAASDPALRQRFEQSYAATYGSDAPRLTTLAYDATALAAVLAKRGAKFDQASLTNPNGFAGVDGIFRLAPSGQVERGLSVLELQLDGAHVIDPAPTAFAPSPH